MGDFNHKLKEEEYDVLSLKKSLEECSGSFRDLREKASNCIKWNVKLTHQAEYDSDLLKRNDTALTAARTETAH